jgi:hypothetical protein
VAWKACDQAAETKTSPSGRKRLSMLRAARACGQARVSAPGSTRCYLRWWRRRSWAMSTPGPGLRPDRGAGWAGDGDARYSLLRAGHARIDAGFHHRFSTEVGSYMGRQVTEHVVKALLLPLPTAARRLESGR